MFMTSISRNNMGFLGGGEKTPEELVEFLKNGAMLRQFHQILEFDRNYCYKESVL